MEAVVRNTMVQGVLSVVFVVLSIIVILAALVATFKAFRGIGVGPEADTEDPAVPSRVFAPAGMVPTGAEREVLAQWRDAGMNTTPAGHH
jgi:carbon starvation protein